MSRFRIIPAIDLIDGQCVRLVHGDFDRCIRYHAEPVELAEIFLEAGLEWLHVVDLDGARCGYPVNMGTVRAIAGTGIHIELGGGMRTEGHISQALDAGVREVILGTSLAERGEMLSCWLDRFPGHLVAGIDSRDGQLVTDGWQTTTLLSALDLVQQLETLGFHRVIYTDIHTDGTMKGPNLEQLEAVAGITRMAVTASGGIGTLEDIHAVRRLYAEGVTGVIVGRAFYEGTISLEDLAAC